MIKSKLILLCLFLFNFFNLNAQENPFLGGWELTGIPADAGYSFQKYFDKRGEFFNTRTAGDKVFNTHHGKYVIKSELEYWEFIAQDTDDFMAQAAGKTAHIYYQFSKDKKLLTLKADPVPGNSGWQETWKRIEVRKVAVKPKSSLEAIPRTLVR
ncbi:DUF4488 domain-containing protein [Pedobacter sp. JCM 36344]|uniref:DUF4488 domain-containing protein n=1 Tax=Pedobacter sp. JCM 36344 TaxID=3374280 RepID=UPI00397B6975